MSSNFTLEELLSFSLGTPEIGAVNFNYLFQVLNEILKHLGISNKLADSSLEDAEYCMQPRSATSTSRSDLKQEQSASHSNGIEAPDSKKSLGDKADATEIGDDKEKPASHRYDFGSKEENTRIISRRETIAGYPQSPPQRGPTRRASNVSAGFSERRSQFAAGGEGAGASNHDFMLVNRSLDRRDSKTPAGDMWHVLNINRRLEAAEATIQGMTNLIDNVSSDVLDLKDNVSNIEQRKSDSDENPSPTDIEMLGKSTDANLDLTGFNKQVLKLSKALKETEASLKKAATKEDIKEFCSTALVEEMIEEKIASQPPISKSLTKVASADQQPKRRESRTKLLQDVISRIMNLEETGVFVNEELEKIKATLSIKTDKQDEDFIDKLKAEIQLLSKEIEKLQVGEGEVNVLKEKLDNFAEENENLKISTAYNTKEQGSIMKHYFKLEKELESLTDIVHTKLGTVVKPQTSQADNEAIAKLKTKMTGLNEQHNEVEKEMHRINKELMKTTEKILVLDEATESLKETKMDKQGFDNLLLLKADKSELKDKINQEKFDSSLGLLDRSLQDALQRVDGQDCILKQFLVKIDARFETKLDREDLHRLKEYIEKRLKSIKVTAPEPTLPDDTAAGFRKPLLRKFHCISCDRPLELLQEDAIPTLPLCQALPGSRAIRPYTTFELEQIRKHMRGDGSNKDRFELAHERERLQKQLLRLSGAHDLDDLAARTSRSCGGSHTLLDPQKRSMAKTTLLYREDSLQIQAAPEAVIEGEVMGRDGHIYKGRVEHLPPLQQKDTSMIGSQTEVPMMARPSLQQSKAEISSQQLAVANKA